MKAITVRQPWAECIARGVKLVENRSQMFTYRGPLLIHVALNDDPAGWLDWRVVREVAEREGFGWLDKGITSREPWELRGAVVAIARLLDCHRASLDCCQPWGDPDSVHLVLDSSPTRLVTPVPYRGQLGLWELPMTLHELHSWGERPEPLEMTG